MTIALGVLLGFFLIQKTDTILDVLGRDVTLTGRTPLWDILIPMGLKKPFGYGFGAFWLGWKGPSAIVWSKVAWMPTMAHNGFIDLWLDIGFPGVILGGLLLIISLLSNFRPALLGSPMELFWVLVILFLLVYNFVETSFLRANHFYWVIMVSAYVSSRYRIPASIKT
jgi:O-antigen ligase